jgi:UDP-N-acetylglucosamine:LPS N-acetylglucosamine transferase
LALIVSGAWGAGEVERAVADVAATGRATPVVVCGRNKVLQDRIAARGDAHVFGWTDQMVKLMAACDVVIENAGGLSCMEALAVGRPVVTYRPIPGHGKHNAEVMQSAGVTQLALTGPELAAALERALDSAGRVAATVGVRLFDNDPAPAIAELIGRP